MDFPKYPRTYHLDGSKGISDPNSYPISTVLNRNIVIEEKIDGSCVGIGFDHERPIIKHRNNDVFGTEWDLLKKWINDNNAIFRQILGERYIMYGDWLYAKHTISYDLLPQFFLEYDVFDCATQSFITTLARRELFANSPVTSVKVLATGKFSSIKEITSFLGQSRYRSFGQMEGLYIKVEDDSKVVSRYKFISKDFLDQIITSGNHWADRSLTKNRIGLNVE